MSTGVLPRGGDTNLGNGILNCVRGHRFILPMCRSIHRRLPGPETRTTHDTVCDEKNKNATLTQHQNTTHGAPRGGWGVGLG